MTKLDAWTANSNWCSTPCKSAPGLDNTLVVFAGDNGIPFPHGKGSLYDPGLLVPFVVRWPGRIQPGSVTNDLASGEDLTPTLLDAAGIRPAKGMTGISFLPRLRGQTYESRKYIFGQRLTHGGRPFQEGTTTHTFDLSRMVRSSKYKLIYNCTPGMQYSPVDSYYQASWMQMSEENVWGRLAPHFAKAYFSRAPSCLRALRHGRRSQRIQQHLRPPRKTPSWSVH